MTIVEPDENRIASILRSVGWEVQDVSLQSLNGGANNRVFLLKSDSEPLVAKSYFRHPGDNRNRLNAEYSFLSYASSQGIRNIPRPVVYDTVSGLGIYSYVNGSQLSQSDITLNAILEAASFFRKLNQGRTSAEALNLSDASESCFSIKDHCELVNTRVERLRNIQAGTDINDRAVEFVSRMQKTWQEILQGIKQRSELAGVDYEQELPQDLRCISPSDFGFHNALRASDGTIIFLDFEYAGWDDPGKMGADFFCQPALPVPEIHIQQFLETALQDFSERDMLISRAKLLLPVYRIKWCCIVLNEFLPDSASRRIFSKGSDDPEKRKAIQLEKAEKLLLSLNSLPLNGDNKSSSPLMGED